MSAPIFQRCPCMKPRSLYGDPPATASPLNGSSRTGSSVDPRTVPFPLSPLTPLEGWARGHTAIRSRAFCQTPPISTYSAGWLEHSFVQIWSRLKNSPPWSSRAGAWPQGCDSVGHSVRWCFFGQKHCRRIFIWTLFPDSRIGRLEAQRSLAARLWLCGALGSLMLLWTETFSAHEVAFFVVFFFLFPVSKHGPIHAIIRWVLLARHLSRSNHTYQIRTPAVLSKFIVSCALVAFANEKPENSWLGPTVAQNFRIPSDDGLFSATDSLLSHSFVFFHSTSTRAFWNL